MTRSRSRNSKLATIAISCFTLLIVAGCGYQEYEARLAETKKYYAYLDRIEQSLAPKWVAQGALMELRVPLQFSQIPPAVPVKNADGTFEPVTIDPRQPDYLNLNFPGVFGAWESTFQIAKGSGATENRKGYIYALSNYWEYAGENASDAGAFVENLKSLLTDKLQITPTEEASQTHPKVAPAYQMQYTYNVCSFKGKNISGTNYTFEVYSRNISSIIGVIVVVLPEGIEMQQKVNERIPMMLETFNFTSTPPKAGANKEKAVAPDKPARPALSF